MNSEDFVRRVWRETKFSAKAVPVVVILIVGMNLWRDHEHGKPFDWPQLIAGVAIILAAYILYVLCRLLFKAILGDASRPEHDR